MALLIISLDWLLIVRVVYSPRLRVCFAYKTWVMIWPRAPVWAFSPGCIRVFFFSSSWKLPVNAAHSRDGNHFDLSPGLHHICALFGPWGTLSSSCVYLFRIFRWFDHTSISISYSSGYYPFIFLHLNTITCKFLSEIPTWFCIKSLCLSLPLSHSVPYLLRGRGVGEMKDDASVPAAAAAAVEVSLFSADIFRPALNTSGQKYFFTNYTDRRHFQLIRYFRF